MHIKPLGNRVVVKLVPKETKSSSGIILTTKEENHQVIGEVLAVGEGQGKENNVKNLGLKKGDKVVLSLYGGEKVSDDENPEIEYRIVQGSEIGGIIIK